MPWRIDPRLAWQLVDGEGIVIDLPNGKVVGFNPVGSLVWSLLETHAEDAIAGEVARRFAIDDLDAVRADVRSFVSALAERGFVAAA
jgi:coenzyme PQQ synthesis protein D (PqqD)